MSWFSCKAAAICLIVALANGLAGCGFKPLYGSKGGSASVVPEFSHISIAQPEDRSEQVLRNTLLDLITPRGAPERPRYLLEYRLHETLGSVFVTRSERITRSNLQLTTHFYLRDYENGQVVSSGYINSQASYNQTLNDYANLVAEKNARERALRDTAEQIRIRLANYFDGWRQQQNARTPPRQPQPMQPHPLLQ